MNLTDEAIKARRNYSRQWREKNRDRIRAYSAAWREKNRDRLKEYNNAYWERKAEQEANNG